LARRLWYPVGHGYEWCVGELDLVVEQQGRYGHGVFNAVAIGPIPSDETATVLWRLSLAFGPSLWSLADRSEELMCPELRNYMPYACSAQNYDPREREGAAVAALTAGIIMVFKMHSITLGKMV
jgi:hypothetical protein